MADGQLGPIADPYNGTERRDAFWLKRVVDSRLSSTYPMIRYGGSWPDEGDKLWDRASRMRGPDVPRCFTRGKFANTLRVSENISNSFARFVPIGKGNYYRHQARVTLVQRYVSGDHCAILPRYLQISPGHQNFSARK